MIKRFTANFSVTEINRIFRHARFPARTLCLRCNSRNISLVSDGRYFCRRCDYLFSLTTGTYLSRSHLDFDQWYELVWWFVYEFTANKTAAETRLSQTLLQRCFSIIRKAIYDYEQKQMGELFSGIIEVDETYVGAKFRNKRRASRDYYRKINAVKRGRGSKVLQQPVFGLYQRNGVVYVKFIEDAGKKTLQDIIKGKIVLESEVYTDTWKSYRGLNDHGYRHRTINHDAGEYARVEKAQRSKHKNTVPRKIHINGIEGFWGYLKERLLKHHGVGKNNLIYYVKEIEFRFNNRKLDTDEMVSKIISILMNSTS